MGRARVVDLGRGRQHGFRYAAQEEAEPGMWLDYLYFNSAEEAIAFVEAVKNPPPPDPIVVLKEWD